MPNTLFMSQGWYNCNQAASQTKLRFLSTHPDRN